eukprot:8087-Eustigmatos_ZCMA.PRE.1
MEWRAIRICPEEPRTFADVELIAAERRGIRLRREDRVNGDTAQEVGTLLLALPDALTLHDEVERDAERQDRVVCAVR